MAPVTKPKATPASSKQTSGEGKQTSKVETTPIKSSNTSPERSKVTPIARVGDVSSSQSQVRTVSTAGPTKPAAATHGPAKQPSGDVDKPEPDAKVLHVTPKQGKSSKQAKEATGNTPAPDSEEKSVTDVQAAEQTTDVGVPDDGLDEVAPEADLENEAAGDKPEETPELEKLEHDLGERLDIPEAEIDKFESKDRDFQDFGKQEEGMSVDSKHASQLTPEQWEELLQNCGALCGWCVDRELNKIVQAPKPAFQIRRQQAIAQAESQDVASVRGTSDTNALVTASAADQESDALSVGEHSGNSDKPCSKPRYHVNDNSFVNVTVSSSEFQTSMATNDFSSHSTEASVGGGFGGFAASVSGGYGASKSNSHVQTDSIFMKTMIAKYMFPRATIYLDPSELEPTPELLASLARINKTKSILDMRKLQQDFGHLFCKQVTVGGRLLTTKIITGTEKKSEQELKEDYKASVGVSASYGVVSASVKHEQGGGSSTAQGQGQENKNETHSFEAVGGDTLLGTNPAAWTTSCAEYSNWRVIDRVNLTPMADAIAEVPGLRSVKALFAQAIPALSRYTEMSHTREIKARLRLASPTGQLSLSYLAKNRQEYTEISYYLGHAPSYEVSPSYLRIKDPANAFWDADFDTREKASKLFFPSSFRAPAIYGRAASMAESAADTVWSITAPFDDVLKHECRVMLRTVPIPQTVKAGQETGQTPSAVALSIFRTQQGEFLPAMSDESQGHIFRMLKRGSIQPGETIKEGDEIRLCWAFQDQTAGFRDFANGAFGRRRHNWPVEVQQSPLFFKLPWPRFESLAAPEGDGQPIPNSLVMSAKAEEEGTIDMFSILPAWNSTGIGSKVMYGVQDVSFSLDVVEDDLGDSQNDYMLQGAAGRRQMGVGMSQLAARFFLDTKA